MALRQEVDPQDPKQQQQQGEGPGEVPSSPEAAGASGPGEVDCEEEPSAQEGPEKSPVPPSEASERELRQRQRATLSGLPRARAAVADMEAPLQLLQARAGEVAALAQRNLQWQRRADRKRPPPELAALLEEDQCSLQRAVDPVEAVADLAQHLAAL